MRIVHALGWYFPDSLGGTELYVANVAKYLERAGHQVHVVAPDAGGARTRHYLHDGVPVFRYPTPLAPDRDEVRGAHAVRGHDHFVEWLQTIQPDVFHSHTFVTGLGLPALRAAKHIGCRVIATTHAASLWFACERGTLLHDGTTLCDGVTRPQRCSACALRQRGAPQALAMAASKVPRPLSQLALSIPGPLGTLLGMPTLIAANLQQQKELYALADHLVVLSDYAAAVLTANGAPADKLSVNRLGVDRRVATFRKAGPITHPTPRPVTVGYVGRVEDIKGLDDLIHAVVALSPTVPLRVRVLAIATSAADTQALAALQHLARNDRRIQFEPPQSPEGVWAFLAGLDVLCCPSRVVEGGPTVALEAYAVGTPVIGSDLPALNEIVRHAANGYLFGPGDRRALSALLMTIALNPAETVDQWRLSAWTPRTFDDVGESYAQLYLN